MVLRRIRRELPAHADRYLAGLRSGGYDGHLEASTAVRLATLLRDTTSDRPLEEYQRTWGKIGTPGALVDDLTASLTRAIEELTRPVDAIKHQAKTVTVGISRNDEGVLDRPLVQAALSAGASRDRLTYRTLKILADLDAAVAEVPGFIRYSIEGDPAVSGTRGATISVVDRGGLSRDVPSRVDTNNQLLGTKRRVASEREVLVVRGRSDGRTVILVPEVKAGACTGITLLHVRFHDRLPGSRDPFGPAGLRPPLRPPRRLGVGDRGDLPRRPPRRSARRRSVDQPDLRGRGPLALVSEPGPIPRGGGSPIRGIGVDAVDVERFRRSLERTPTMRARLFTPVELEYVAPKSDPVPSLAARFAAREAVMKAMGVGLGAFGFHDVWVERAASGEPSLRVAGPALELAERAGITAWHLSITHTAIVAIAYVVAT